MKNFLNLILIPILIIGFLPFCNTSTETLNNSSNVEKSTFNSAVKIKISTFQSEVQLIGKIQTDPIEKLDVTIPMGGKITNLSKLPGEYVNKGETICYFENHLYLELQKTYLNLKNQIEFESLQNQRLKQLIVGQSISKKELEESDFKLNALKIQLASTKRELNYIGVNPINISPETLNSRVPYISPLSGKITKITGGNGLNLSQDSRIFTIISNEKLFAHFTAYSKDLNKFKTGQTVTIVNPENQEIITNGKITSIDDNIQENGTFTVVVKVDKCFCSDGQTIIGKVKIKSTDCLVLPKSNVVEYQGKHYIVANVDNTPKNIEIKWLGEDSNNSYFILSNPNIENSSEIEIPKEVWGSNTYGIFMKNLQVK